LGHVLAGDDLFSSLSSTINEYDKFDDLGSLLSVYNDFSTAGSAENIN